MELEHQILPPTPGTEDPEQGLDVVLEARPAPGLRHALSSGFAFGGLNSALLLEAP